MDHQFDAGFDENEYFESQYADELAAFDDIQSENIKDVSQKEIGKSQSQPSTTIDDLFNDNDFQALESTCNKRRKLFSNDETEKENNFDEFELENDLIIDEAVISMSPLKKKPRLEEKRKLNLPTTLDADRDLRLKRKQEHLVQNFTSTPQLLAKIQTYRDNRHNSETIFSEVATNGIAKPRIELTKVLSCPPNHSEFMPATSSDGVRCYMRLRPLEKISMSKESDLITGSKSKQLLPFAIAELRQSVNEKREAEAIRRSKELTEQTRNEALNLNSEDSITRRVLADSMTSSMDPSSMTSSMECSEDEGVYSGEEAPRKDALWVNKFAPTHYTHLLSDENVNRTLLKWLKMWDKVVFGREFKPRKTPEKENNQFPQKYKNDFKAKFAKNQNKLTDDFDEHGRPFLKTALLHGPPGLGKTTLAHIIAKHAGYHVVEMNASDDRSAEVFKRKLEETTEMKSVLGADERPNCLIIDEIDGAPQAAINILLNAINKTKKPDPKKRKSKKDSKGILLRPIICICNDLYTPALRLFRQQSLLLHFPPTTTGRLASRLVQMCRVQHFSCDMTSLLTLCEKSGNDIRTCINTLQFVQSKGTKQLTVDMVKSMSIGQKDQHKSIFYVWNELFQLPKNKRKMDRDSETVQQGILEGGKVSQFSSRFYHILNVISSNGEYQKTLEGVFDNFLTMKFKDHCMQAVNKGYEWLLLYDQLQVSTHQRQEWIMQRYVPFLFVAYHLLFACIRPPKINFPQAKQENKMKLQKSNNLLTTMFMDMSPDSKCFTSPQVAALDTLPHLLTIMTPSLRPVNMQLYSALEKKQLSDLVGAMMSYNLTYTQQKNEEGQYNYVMEPNMEEVSQFNGLKDRRKTVLSYAIKQIISKEVESEKMRRSEMMLLGREQNKVFNKPKPIEPKPAAVKLKTPNHLQRLETSIIAAPMPDKPVINFFSQFKKIKKLDQDGNERVRPKTVEVSDPGIGNSQLWYKFNEGYSNAVRTTLYTKDFFLP